MSIANIAVPLAAAAVGGPVGGIAASAAMGGINKAIEGGSLKEALLSGAIQGGGSALTAGVGGAIGGKVASEGTKLGADEIKKGLADTLANKTSKVGLGLTADALTGGAKKGFGLGMGDMFKTAVTGLVGEAAVDTAVDTIGTNAKVRFIEQSQKFAQRGIDTYGAVKAEQAQNMAINEQINANSAIKPVVQDGQFVRGKSRFYQPYGG